MRFFVVLMGAACSACGFWCAYQYAEDLCKIPGKTLLLKESICKWMNCSYHRKTCNLFSETHF